MKSDIEAQDVHRESKAQSYYYVMSSDGHLCGYWTLSTTSTDEPMYASLYNDACSEGTSFLGLDTSQTDDIVKLAATTRSSSCSVCDLSMDVVAYVCACVFVHVCAYACIIAYVHSCVHA